MPEDEAADVSTTKSLRLSRIADARTDSDDGEGGVIWTWTETVHIEKDGRRQTSFLWVEV